MISNIIRFSVKNKLIVGLLVLSLIGGGLYSMMKLPIDAVPDITNNQVQIVTTSPSLAPQEVEQFITFPVEMAMANIPDVDDIRSISRFGLSVVTVVFSEDVPIMRARQFVKEQIDIAHQDIPSSLGIPEMMPITTGLGEIYQYVLEVDSAYTKQYDPMDLRTIQDWIVKRQMAGIDGIIEVSSFGGYLKQYEVSVDPHKLQANGTTITDVFDALEANNQNTGGSYIEKGESAYYIRTEGLVTSVKDIENIVVKSNDGVPVLIRNVANVKFGSPQRFGAMTMDGKGEVVGGITLMLKGANSSEAINNVHQRVKEVQKLLPDGVRLKPYLDRSVLVGKAIGTVSKNLIEGGLIVIFVLILLLGNFRAGLIVASVIPLSLMVAFILMHLFGVSANLMSLGAIDFGIVVDGAVIIVESVLHLIYTKHIGKRLSQGEMDDVIIKTSSGIIGSAAFGVLIIVVVFIPIMTLTGIEGKMFTPMAKTVSFAILGALLLSVTYVPAMSALFLNKEIKTGVTFADRIVRKLRSWYKPVLERVLRVPYAVLGVASAMLIAIIYLFGTMGAEFIPTLDEGDMAMQVTIEPGSSLTEMISTTTEAEAILKNEFPEVKHVVSKIGTAEVPTDPMAVEDADVMILLKDRSEWTSASSREELASKMKAQLSVMEKAQFDFTQPIQLRFNELISGAKTDVVIKLFGEDLEELSRQGQEIAAITRKVKGAGDVKIEQTEGLPQLMVRFNRQKVAFYHLSIDELNRIVRSAFAGENAGIVYEGERRFDLTVRLDKKFRNSLNLSKLFVNTHSGMIPLSEVAEVKLEDGPMQVSRENAKRRISVGVNIRERDIASFIDEVQEKIDKEMKLAPGYFIEYGGEFENLEAAKARLMIAVPIALILIFILLFFSFGSVKYALMIYSTVPLSAIGGVLALLLRGMPFSISAGVGFIALFGVAVLNGIVLLSYFNRLKDDGEKDLKTLVINGSIVRLRPVLMTAAVASLGFLPMAISTSAGAEVQKPLATVVIGGLISATLLTLVVLPVLYYIIEKRQFKMNNTLVSIFFILFFIPSFNAQQLTEEMAIDSMLKNNYELYNVALSIDQYKTDARKKVSLGNTSASYSYGQINSTLFDGYWSINQSLGNPFFQLKQAKEASRLAIMGELEFQRTKAEKIRDVRSAWHNWVLYNRSIELLNEQLERMELYLIQLEARAKEGEVSEVDVGLAEIYRSELIGKINSLQMLELHTENRLKGLSRIEGEIEVPDDAIDIVIDLPPSLDHDSSELTAIAVEKARYEASMMTVRKEKSRSFPELSVGYFNQSIDHQSGLQGFSVGISVPILNRNHYSEIQKSNLQSAIQNNNYLNAVYRSEQELRNLQTNLEIQRQLIETYSESWSRQSELLKNAATNELNSGEIDYYKYLQAQGKSLDLELRRMELLNAYNQTCFELTYKMTKVK